MITSRHFVFALCLGLLSSEAARADSSLSPPAAENAAAQLMAENTDLAAIVLATSPDGNRDLTVLVDPRGNLGRKIGAEDQEIVDLDDTLIRPEMSGVDPVIAVHAALHNRADAIAGFVELLFKRQPGATLLTVHARSDVLLAELAEKIGDAAPLPPAPPEAPAAAPGPARTYGKAADNKIFAQLLVNRILAAHPELVGAGLHAVPPDGNDQCIVAQSRDLIGKHDSTSDIAVTKWDGIRFEPEVKAAGSWIAVLARIRTADGQTFGLTVLSFRHNPGVTKLSVHVKAQVIMDQLAEEIATYGALFQPARL